MNALDILTMQAKEAQEARIKAQRALDTMRLAVDKMIRTVQACKDRHLLDAPEGASIPAEELRHLSAQEVANRLTPCETRLERIVQGCKVCMGVGEVVNEYADGQKAEICAACGGEG